MNTVLFEGVAPALVTPFRNGKIDFDALDKLIEHQLGGGVNAFVVLGSTGEASTLKAEEKEEIIKFCINKIKGRAKVIVGTGSNDTATAIEQSVKAKELGADGLLIVTPYYNKATQKGLIAHFTAIANATQLPIILYNIPGRTGINMTPATVMELAKNKYIVGLKESNNDISQIIALHKNLRDKIAIYCGDDGLAHLFNSFGAKGIISVAANLVPDLVVRQYSLYKNGKIAESLTMHEKLYDFNNDLLQEINPICIKASLAYKGFCTDEMRMPLTTIEEPHRDKLVQTLKALGI